MGFFEDMFNPELTFYSDHQQRTDLLNLKGELAGVTDKRIPALERQVSGLMLLCNALVEVIERKGIATRAELEVLVQQIDLLDGREDGKQSVDAWRNAPRCTNCNHYVNPQREACVYCGQPLSRGQGSGHGPYRGGPGADAPAPRTAVCAQCSAMVPQSDTYFTEEGRLLCSACYS